MKCFLSVSLILLTQFAAIAEIIHHSKFDGDLVAEGGKSWRGKSIGYLAGVTGKAVDLKRGSYISFSDDVHFSSEEGTLEMWIKTHWAGNDGKEHGLLALGKSSGLRIMKSKENELMFIWKPGEHPQFGFKFSIANDWPKQEWRHLVLTWKRDSFFAYVDGIVRSGGLAEAVPAPLPETSPLYLGCTDPVPGDLMVDELTLRNDALTRAEVLENYARGMSQLELRGDPRLVMRVLIDQSPATLILDTGCTLNVLFKPFATEANLKLLPSYRGGEVFNEETDATLTQMDGRSFKMRFIVLKNETDFPQQGMLGWEQFFTANRLHILWDHRAMKPMSEVETKTTTRGWQEHDFSSNLHKLMLPAVSMRMGNVEVTLPLIIDTGDATGLSFTKKVWDSLQPQLDQEKRSLSANWTPNRGTQRHIDFVPESIEILGARMNGISLSLDQHQRDASSGLEEARMGLAALSYFDVVIDGIAQKLWLRPRSAPALHEDINLSGLLFEYDRSTDSKKHTAFVLSGSLAWNLGLRTGDEIIEVDGKPPAPNDVDHEYQIDVKQRLSHGEAIQIKVRREQQIFEIRQESESSVKP